jgi:hypothetical protein
MNTTIARIERNEISVPAITDVKDANGFHEPVFIRWSHHRSRQRLLAAPRQGSDAETDFRPGSARGPPIGISFA